MVDPLNKDRHMEKEDLILAQIQNLTKVVEANTVRMDANFKEIYGEIKQISILSEKQAVLQALFDDHKEDEKQHGKEMDTRIKALENNPLIKIGLAIGAISLIIGVIIGILSVLGRL
jgi:hypothetical protein